MTPLQHVFAVVTSVLTLIGIVELVRRRKLREEYAWLWIATSIGMVVLSAWYGLLAWLSRLIGAVAVTTTLFLFALLFLLVISIHYSTVISRLSTQVRRLAQELAIRDAEQEQPQPSASEDRPRA